MKKQTYNRVLTLFIRQFWIWQLIFSLYILSPQKLFCEDIGKLYMSAMEAFHQKDYKKAIQDLEQILQIDPTQKNPVNLIQMAKAKMQDNIKSEIDEYNKLIASGEYQKASDKVSQFIEHDPANLEFIEQKNKLDKFIKTVTPSIIGPGKVNNLLRKSVSAYLGKPKDERLPVLASRYAWQIGKVSQITKDVFIFMDKEFTVISRLEVMDNSKNVVEQKLEVILNAIYDGKYEYAIAECELVIELEPDNIMAWKRLGSVYYAQGKPKQAKSTWESALKLAPNDEELKKFLQRTK